MSLDKQLQWFERVLSKEHHITFLTRFGLHLRRNLIAGLVTATPIFVTVVLSLWLFDMVVKSAWVKSIAHNIGIQNVYFAAFLTILGILLIVYFLGMFSATLFAKILIRVTEKTVSSIPLVKSIYALVKQIVDAFHIPDKNDSTFERRIVLIEYPRYNCLAMGVLTGETLVDGKLYCQVLVLTTPNPTTGWVCLLPREEVFDCGLELEVGMKFILSGGIVAPPSIKLSPYKSQEEITAESMTEKGENDVG